MYVTSHLYNCFSYRSLINQRLIKQKIITNPIYQPFKVQYNVSFHQYHKLKLITAIENFLMKRLKKKIHEILFDKCASARV